MVEKLYYCPNCFTEQFYPSGSDVWCHCRPRVKMKMKMYNNEQQKIRKLELKINTGYIE
jgi:hypothetical protein